MRNKIFLLALGIFLLSAYAPAYTIDGNLSDWGVDLTEDWGLNGTWVPSSGTADWIVEDNIDPDCPTQGTMPNWEGHNCLDWSGYTATGVHIQGTGSSYSVYDEPVFPDHGGIYEQPAGGEHYDIEAMYFDDDSHYAYFAIVTSMGPNGWAGWYPGDLALDLNRDGYYEYGIILTGSDQGKICHNPGWSSPTDFPSSEPVRITSCNNTAGIADVVYTDTSINDNEVKNWVIEIRAPKTALGEPVYGQISNLHATITCGNDVIELLSYTWDFPLPEFVSGLVAFLIVLVTPSFGYLLSKKR